jgi:hypothetical protein
MSIVITEKLAEEIKVGDLIRDTHMISFQKVNDIDKSGQQIVLWLDKNIIGGRKQGKSLVSLIANEPVEFKQL